MEAKNVIHSDFLVRQLYYPFRVYKNNNGITKDIPLVFSIYSNQIYRLYEYKFNTLNDYSSIDLVQKKYYSLQDTNITLDDLKRVRNETSVTTDDNMNISEIPFPQANSFDRVINLLDN